MARFELSEFHRDVTDDALLADLQSVANQLGRSPTIPEYNELGKYHASTVARRFGRWTEALKVAGLGPTRSELNIPREDLLQNIEEVWSKLGKQPTYNNMDEPFSRFSAGTYANRFGSWRGALEAFVAGVNQDVVDDESNAASVLASDDPALRVGSRTRHINWRVRFLVLQRDRFTCVSCGRSPAKDPSIELHVDHTMPWSRGGASTIENLQTLCSVCNIGKSDLEA